jgi:alpha-amylase
MSEQKGVMFQFFEWNVSDDGSLWNKIAESAPALRGKGVTAIWFPPPTKGYAGSKDVGYGAYDLFDLGEFDQKGSVRTKYGTKAELLHAVETVQAHQMDAYIDVVMNHRIGGDETEEVQVVEVNPFNRLEEVSDPYTIRAWSRYACAPRAGAHSNFVWTREHFNAFGADANHPEVDGKIYRVADRAFSSEVDKENGNFDYLMGANVDHQPGRARRARALGRVAARHDERSRRADRRGQAHGPLVRVRLARAGSRDAA